MSLKFVTILSLFYQTTFSTEGDEAAGEAGAESSGESGGEESSNQCETAFGYSTNDNSLCFLDDDSNDFSRWGWTIGPLTFIEGEYDDTFDLYAGAADCDFENKGYKAGSVEVSINSDGTFSAHFMGDDSWSFSEFHVYIGTTEYPIDENDDSSVTVAPGSYPFKLELDGPSNDYTLSDSIGDDFDSDNNEYYIIVHAVACNDDIDDDDDDEPTPVTTDDGGEDESDCLADDYYIVLSNGWGISGTSYDGTYYYDSETQSFYRDSNGGGEGGSEIAVIFFQDVGNGILYLVIGDENNEMSQISYTLSVDEWSDDSNPLYDSDYEANWENVASETATFSTGEMALFDCNDVDLGDEICGLENVSVLPSVYDCSSEGGNPINYSNAMKNNEITMGVILTTLVVLMFVWY